MLQYILFLLLLFGSNLIQSITGFGGNMVSMPIAVRLMDIEQAKAVMNLFFASGSFLIAYKNRKYINYMVLKHMLFAMIGGMIAGMVLYQRISLDILLRWYAIFLIVVALKKMFDLYRKETLKLPEKETQSMNGTFGFLILLAAGLLQGMLLSGGSLLVIYAITKMKGKDEFRATVSAVWVVLGVIMAGWHGYRGHYNKDVLLLTVISLFFLFLSRYLGELLYQKIAQKGFLKLTYVLVLLAGISLLL